MVQRPPSEERMEFSVVRQRINYPVVTYDFDASSNVAIIQITIFGDRTTAELDAALTRKDDGAAGIVLDLRNNGGGWVQSAQETIGRFLKADAGPALYEDFDPLADGDEQAEEILTGRCQRARAACGRSRQSGHGKRFGNRGWSASDYDRAEIVGERTFGKGSVQRVHEFDDGASLRLTFAQWLTPKSGPSKAKALPRMSRSRLLTTPKASTSS